MESTTRSSIIIGHSPDDHEVLDVEIDADGTDDRQFLTVRAEGTTWTLMAPRHVLIAMAGAITDGIREAEDPENESHESILRIHVGVPGLVVDRS